MNSNSKIVLILLIFSLLFSIVFAGETHCWRQNISRLTSISYTFRETYSSEPLIYSSEPLIVPKEAVLTITGFGNYNYMCDDGASGTAINYFEVYDKKTGQVINTNGISSGGPITTGAVMCYDNANNIACYKEGENFIPERGVCDLHAGGTMFVGKGATTKMDISLADFQGEQEWVIRFGAITPYFSGITPGSEKITFRDVVNLNFFVDSSKPSILVFPPTPLQKINTFTLEEDVNKEVFFTLLNKSRIPIRINDYSIDCPPGFNCFLEKNADGNNYYSGYTIGPNQAMIIDVTYSIDKDSIPAKGPSTMKVKFTPNGFKDCPLEGCIASSSPLQFQVGLIDQQDFQINVSNQQEQKYCVDSEGRVGRTGESYLPKINLYFGGNNPLNSSNDSSDETTDSLISPNECSSINYLTGGENQDWVYCTQKEFLVQLARRIDLYYTNLTSIKSLESLARFSEAQELREANGLISNFPANLRAQNLNFDNRSTSISELAEINDIIFSRIGFLGEQIDDISKLESLIKGITIRKLVNGVPVDALEITPGEYDVSIDINIDNDIMGLFAEGELNDQVNILVSLEKKSEPKLNWFFYYQDNNFDNINYAPTIESIYTNNYSKRGLIMSFEKENGGVGELKNFYSTYSVPLITRLVDQNSGEDYISDSKFEVNINNHTYETGDIFSVWSGFASSLGEKGCESTVKSTSKKGLPYRVLDIALDELGRFEIPDLNNLKSDTKMYLSTVLYLPSNEEIHIKAPFNVYTQNDVIEGDQYSIGTTIIKASDYPENKIDSLKKLFENISEEKVCILYDNSTSVEKWDLFWNQDKILDQLENVKANIDDAKRCETSELKAS
jgi:hypothetical protein